MRKNDYIQRVPESSFSSILEGITFISNAQSPSQAVANDAPKTPAPGVAAPSPAEFRATSPLPSLPKSANKLSAVSDQERSGTLPGFFRRSARSMQLTALWKPIHRAF